MTVADLMRRPMADVQNYAQEVVPLLRLGGKYWEAFIDSLIGVPGNIYAVANFNPQRIGA